MRTASAASIRPRRQGNYYRRERPAPGTKVREIYDAFFAAKGVPISFKASTGLTGPLDQLRDVYGLDIRRIARCKWVLAGEWFGRVYVDYIAERLLSGGK